VRTFAALVFIAAVAIIAISLARTSTIADGRVLEAEILPAFRGQGVVGVACDREIPVGRQGAQFGCTASLGGGATQQLACTLGRDGRFACKPASGVKHSHDAPGAGDAPPRPERNAPSGDPWAN